MIILSIIILIILIYFLHSIRTTKKERNCFFVISTEVTENMYNEFSKVIKDDLYFISDKEPQIQKNNIYYYDSQLMKNKGYTNTHNKIHVTSWDKVFYHIENNNILNEYDYIWIIEDDCFLNKNKFNNFIRQYNNKNHDLILFGWYKRSHEYWDLWKENNILNKKAYFEKDVLRSCITQFCRLSPILINKILELRQELNRFCFHEIAFPSLAAKNNLTTLVEKRADVFLSAFKKDIELNSLKQNYVVFHPKKHWYNEIN